MTLQNLRGFRDIYPEDMLIKRKIFDKMHDTAKSYGFKEIDTPSIEHLDLFKKKSGDEITNQVFSFKDKGDRQVTLIPETTPSIARMFVTKKNMIKPVKWYSISKLWRYEEPQSGRTREFYQFNADIIGSKSIKADFEIISLAVEILNKLGLEGKYTIDISDRIILEGILQKLGIKNINEAGLKNLSTSWGPFQLMGYKCIILGIYVKDIRGDNSVYWGVKWINKTYGKYLKKGRF